MSTPSLFDCTRDPGGGLPAKADRSQGSEQGENAYAFPARCTRDPRESLSAKLTAILRASRERF